MVKQKFIENTIKEIIEGKLGKLSEIDKNSIYLIEDYIKDCIIESIVPEVKAFLTDNEVAVEVELPSILIQSIYEHIKKDSKEMSNDDILTFYYERYRELNTEKSFEEFVLSSLQGWRLPNGTIVLEP